MDRLRRPHHRGRRARFPPRRSPSCRRWVPLDPRSPSKICCAPSSGPRPAAGEETRHDLDRGSGPRAAGSAPERERDPIRAVAHVLVRADALLRDGGRPRLGIHGRRREPALAIPSRSAGSGLRRDAFAGEPFTTIPSEYPSAVRDRPTKDPISEGRVLARSAERKTLARIRSAAPNGRLGSRRLRRPFGEPKAIDAHPVRGGSWPDHRTQLNRIARPRSLGIVALDQGWRRQPAHHGSRVQQGR